MSTGLRLKIRVLLASEKGIGRIERNQYLRDFINTLGIQDVARSILEEDYQDHKVDELSPTEFDAYSDKIMKLAAIWETSDLDIAN